MKKLILAITLAITAAQAQTPDEYMRNDYEICKSNRLASEGLYTEAQFRAHPEVYERIHYKCVNEAYCYTAAFNYLQATKPIVAEYRCGDKPHKDVWSERLFYKHFKVTYTEK